jgi:Tfp pilus assembly protein PilZ
MTELDGLSLNELAGRLRDVNTTRTPLGWPTANAVTKSTVERRIVDLVARRDPEPGLVDPNQKLECDLSLKVRSASRPSLTAERVVVQLGGVFVPTDVKMQVGEPVELEITSDSAYKLRVRGNVAWLAHGDKPGVGIGFQSTVGDSAERRLERLILELVRNRL